MKQVFNLVKLFLVILLVSFTSCTNDLSEKNKEISFSFELPQEKINRATNENSDNTLWNINAQIENTKDIIQKIEKTAYSGETVTLTFKEIIVGQEVKINIDLTKKDEKTPTYTGSSDWFIVKNGNNKINLKLNKVEENTPQIIDATIPEIITQPQSIVEIATPNSTTITKTLSVSAKSTDNGTLSFIWQEKNSDDTWKNFEPITTTTYTDKIESSIKVTVEKGKSRTFKCIITNTNNSVNRNTTATIETNEATIAYVEGDLTSITATYKSGEYQILGQEFNYSKVTIAETYTKDNTTPPPVTLDADSSRYTISPTKDGEKAIGYVPYTVSCISSTNITTNLTVPVKYQLNANDFVITGSNQNNGNQEKIAQFTGNTVLSVGPNGETSSVPSLKYETENSDSATDYNIMGNLQSVWKKTIKNQTTDFTDTKADNSIAGTYIYTNTLTVPTDDTWVIGESIQLDYYVQVCPWTLAVNSNDGNSVEDLQNLTGDTIYTLSAKNEAYENPSVTFTSDNNAFAITNNTTLKTPQASTESDLTATITAIVDDVTIGTITVIVKQLGSQANPITQWSDLSDYISNLSNSADIYIQSNLTANSKITVGKPIKIIPVGNVTITRSSNFIDEFFLTNDSFEIAGTPTAKITLNGDDIEANKPIINSTSSLTLSYCDFKNNINKSSDGGAIYVSGNNVSNVNFSYCNFDNNSVTYNNMAGGAVAINSTYAISNFNNCTFTNNKALQQGGGAVYISGKTSNCSKKWHTFENCTFENNEIKGSYNFGGAIYVVSGPVSLISVTMQNNKYYINDSDYVSSDIHINGYQQELKLAGTIKISDFKIQIHSNTPKDIGVSPEFDTTNSKIDNLILSVSIGTVSNITQPFKIYSYDSVGTSINAEQTSTLTSEQIACFPSITDEDGTSYTLNPDGTITEANAGGSSGTTYLIGDLYSQNNTPMGVVFEVAEDNSYVKIIALDDLINGALLDSGWIDTKYGEETVRALDLDDGSNNMNAYLTWKNYMSEAYPSKFSDDKAFFETYNYYVLSDFSDKNNWYLPAKNELYSIMLHINTLNNTLDNDILTGRDYWSSTIDSTYTKAYTYTSNLTQNLYSLSSTNYYARPVMKINF